MSLLSLKFFCQNSLNVIKEKLNIISISIFYNVFMQCVEISIRQQTSKLKEAVEQYLRITLSEFGGGGREIAVKY